MKRTETRLPEALAFALLLLGVSPAFAAEFDHDSTGYPLVGLHRSVTCESCHVGGIFEGTETRCESCHGGGSSLAPGKPLSHIPSSNRCEDCHRALGWEDAVFDHFGIETACVRCHDGVISRGKGPFHVATSNRCEDCHTTVAWEDARFDHTGITANCSSCHDGGTAAGKPPTHLPTSASCELCHTTLAWSPATFDHSTVTGGCRGCHDGVTSTGKDGGHFVTNRECNVCHDVADWAPLIFRHLSAAYPGDHRRRVDCSDCHQGNSEMVPWRFPAYQPDCAGCHASDFKSGPHKKYENPDHRYSVGELRDCTGACHVYTNSSLTTIKKHRSGHHRVTDRGWD